MMNKVKALLVLGAFAVMATGTAQAQIQTTAGCSLAKMKCAVNKLKGNLGCEGKAAKGGIPVDPLCTSKVNGKFSGSATACIEKADTKFPGALCPQSGDGGLGAQVDAFVADVKATTYTNPAPMGANACAAGQMKCVTNLYKGVTGADGKALKSGLFVDPLALAKPIDKFSAALTGCVAKLEAAGKACTLTGATGLTQPLLAKTTALVNKTECGQSPAGATYSITTVAGAGACGITNGLGNPTLNCGALYIGNGLGGVPYGATPAGTASIFTLAGGKNRVCPRSAAQTGSNRNCTDLGCFFGSPLPIVNAGLSTCVDNTFFATKGYGSIQPLLGSFSGDILLGSTVTVTGNSTQPCPLCVGGFCDATSANYRVCVGGSNPGTFCVTGAACTGAGQGTCPVNNLCIGGFCTTCLGGGTCSAPGTTACTADSTSGESHDCVAAGPALPTFVVALADTTTGTVLRTSGTGIFCPGQLTAGAFGDGAVTVLSETGSPAGNLTALNPLPSKLAALFCIPATGNVLIDADVTGAGLPGPGATTLVVGADIN